MRGQFLGGRAVMREKDGVAVGLGGHLKTGQLGTLQNRPVERSVVFYAFYWPVKTFGQGGGQPVSLVLGYVMDHEIAAC